MAHTFDAAKADRLDDTTRYRYCSREELLDLIEVESARVVSDLGSGTGFYTIDIAPYVDIIYGVDVQLAMHEHFVANGVPANVELVTAEAGALPFGGGVLDVCFSTMTFHEFAGTGAVDEVARVLRPGGRFVAVDWSEAGEGEAGPPRAERHDLASASDLVESSGLEVRIGRERAETFVLVAAR